MNTIYLAGPMSGIPQHNFPAFKTAAYTLRREGHTVFSPAELDIELYGAEIFEKNNGEPMPEVDPRVVIKNDLNWIIDHADTLALLPGWTNSKGCAVESALAHFLGLKILYL